MSLLPGIEGNNDANSNTDSVSEIPKDSVEELFDADVLDDGISHQRERQRRHRVGQTSYCTHMVMCLIGCMCKH